MMSFLSNVKIKNKLILMLVLPILGLLYFSMNKILDEYKLLGEMNSLDRLSFLAVTISPAMHEFQKERGISAGFIGSKGTRFVSELPAQRTETDKKLTELRESLKNIDGSQFGAEFGNSIDKAVNNLGMLGEKRNSISGLSITAQEAVTYYSNTITSLLDVIVYMIKLSTNAEVSTQITAYFNFLQGKEWAGRERAFMTNIFVANRFEAGELLKFSSIIAKEDAYFNTFLSFATAHQKSFYENKLSNHVMDEIAKMREIAFDKASEGNFGVDEGYWFKTMTEKINLMKEVEDRLSDDLKALTGELKTHARTALLFSGTATMSIIAVVLFLSYFITRSITVPLSMSIKILDRLSKNDLTVDIKANSEDRVLTLSKDEIGQMLAAMKNMVENLKKVITNVKSMTDNVASASEELSASATQIAKGTTSQTERATTVATSSEEMSATVMEVAKNASGASESAKDANKLAQKGKDMVENTVHGMNDIASAVKESASVITRLGTRSNEIGEIIKVINDIADQTNLLALNAAIEAARAGEYGRGFAVVADEVRKLAEKTTKATKEIGGMINTIQDETGKAVASMGAVQKEVEEEVKIAKDAGSSLNEIVSNVDKLTGQIQQIAVASEEQSAATDTISRDIQDIANTTKETSASSTQIAEASNDLSKLAANLQGIVGQFKI